MIKKLKDGEIYEVKNFLPHPNFNAESQFHVNLAIVEIRGFFQFSPTIELIQLIDKPLSFGTYPLTIAGWGQTENEPLPTHLKISERLSLVGYEQCKGLILDTGKLNSKNHICAKAEDGKSPCSGDEGAGLVYMIDGRWRLVGVLTHASKSCSAKDAAVPSVYTNVLPFKAWIVENGNIPNK